MVDNNESESVLPVSRRSVLKAGAVSAVGAGVFSGTASASDVPAAFQIECLGDEGRVTLTTIDGRPAAELLGPDFRVYIGKESVVLPGGANDDEVDAIAEIGSCFFDEYSYKECPSPIAILSDPEAPGDGTLVYTFDLADAGLDTVTDETAVLVAGAYPDSDGNLEDEDGNKYQSFDSLDAYTDRDEDPTNEEDRVFFDPSTCCIECPTEGELLVKYEYDEENGTFVAEEGGDDNIRFVEITETKDGGEPLEARFASEYCELEVVVKAGPEESEPEVIDLASDGTRTSEFLVETPNDKAISNVQFYCP